MRQISRRMEMISPRIGWRQDEYGTHKHAHSSRILWSLSRVLSKTMHSLFCITSWLPYITLCYIDSRFFLPLEQSRMALLGCRFAASRLHEAARWQLGSIVVHWDESLWKRVRAHVNRRKQSREQRGGGSWGFEPCTRGGSCNFQLPLGGGSPYFIT